MGYPIDLDEIPTVQILAEVQWRDNMVTAGRCPYCKAPLMAHTCRYKGKEDTYHPTSTAQAGRKE